MWLGVAALQTHAALITAELLIALLALGTALVGGRLTRYPVWLLSLLLSAEWFVSLGYSIKIGYFSHLPAAALIRALLPGLLCLTLVSYACWVAWRCYRRA